MRAWGSTCGGLNESAGSTCEGGLDAPRPNVRGAQRMWHSRSTWAERRPDTMSAGAKHWQRCGAECGAGFDMHGARHRRGLSVGGLRCRRGLSVGGARRMRGSMCEGLNVHGVRHTGPERVRGGVRHGPVQRFGSLLRVLECVDVLVNQALVLPVPCPSRFSCARGPRTARPWYQPVPPPCPTRPENTEETRT